MGMSGREGSKLLAQLRRHEGVRLRPYTCSAGKLTIGVGRNLDDRGITQEEATVMLMHDVVDCRVELKKRPVFRTLDGVRQSVLVNMAFNLGVQGLDGFTNMWGALAEDDYSRAGDEMLDSKWAQQVGQRAVELADQMRTGEWQQ